MVTTPVDLADEFAAMGEWLQQVIRHERWAATCSPRGSKPAAAVKPPPTAKPQPPRGTKTCKSCGRVRPLVCFANIPRPPMAGRAVAKAASTPPPIRSAAPSTERLEHRSKLNDPDRRRLLRLGYPLQKVRIAFWSACTLGKPKANAAALMLPNWSDSAETLTPWQFVAPGCPAKVS
jgi:hypothetical protein